MTTPRVMSRRLAVVLTMAIQVLPSLPAQVMTWSGSGDWTQAGNWSGGVVPGASNVAQLQSGSVNVADARSVRTLAHSGGILTGSGALTLTGTGSNWASGSMTGTGTTTIARGASLAITTSSVHDFNGRRIVNEGTIDWQGGPLRSGNGGSILNSAGAVFNDTASSTLSAAYGGTLTFTNAGTYNKSEAGTTQIAATFTNQGTLNLNTGTLALAGGGSSTAGSLLKVAAGAILRFEAGTFAFADAASLVDAGGAYQVTGGTVDFGTGALSLPILTVSGGAFNAASGGLSATRLTITGGTVGGGTISTAGLSMSGGSVSAPLTLSGVSSWTGGSWNASAPALVSPGATLNIGVAAVHDFNARALTNRGTINWQAGQLRSGGGGSITNVAGAFINDTASSAISGAYGGEFTVINAGTYNKDAAGTTTLAVPFVNQGALNVNAGTFELSGGGSNAVGATMNVASGATLRFGGGTFLISNAGGLPDTGGAYEVSGAAVTVSSGALSLPGLVLSSGSLALAADGLFVPALTMSGGTLSGAGSIAPTVLTLGGGSIAAPISIRGNSTWSGGDLNGGGAAVTIEPGATLNVTTSTAHDFRQRLVTNQGTVNWQAGQLRSGGGGVIINSPGATFTDAASSAISASYGGTMTFTNRGTYQKTAAGTTDIQIPFTNDGGTVAASAGILRFSSTFSHVGGVLAVDNGATLQFDRGLSLPAGKLTGSGTIAGSVVAGGTVSPGNNIGGLNVTGDLTLAATSTLVVQLAGPTPGVSHDFLSISGNTILNGALHVAVTQGFAASIQPGDTFTVLNAASLAGAFTNVPVTGFRIMSVEGLGTFQVNFGPGSAFAPNALVLSHFAAIPEPSTWALLLAGAAVVLWTLRRRT